MQAKAEHKRLHPKTPSVMEKITGEHVWRKKKLQWTLNVRLEKSCAEKAEDVFRFILLGGRELQKQDMTIAARFHLLFDIHTCNIIISRHQ